MFRFACTRKEASCIVGSLLGELRPACEQCVNLADGDIALATEDGLVVLAKELAEIEGRSAFTGKPVKIKFTEYGFEYYGDPAEVKQIRKARCLYGTVHTAKEG